MPDFRNSDERYYESDGNIFFEANIEGTHLGTWVGWAPTGRSFKVPDPGADTDRRRRADRGGDRLLRQRRPLHAARHPARPGLEAGARHAGASTACACESPAFIDRDSSERPSRQETRSRKRASNLEARAAADNVTAMEFDLRRLQRGDMIAAIGGAICWSACSCPGSASTCLRRARTCAGPARTSCTAFETFNILLDIPGLDLLLPAAAARP